MSQDNGIRFREARKSDAEWATRLIVGSAVGRFAHFHENQIDELQAYLKREFSSDMGLFSHKHHIVIEHCAVAVGVVCMFRSLEGTVHACWTLCHMLRCLGLRKTVAVLQRRHSASGRMPPFSRSSAYADNLCIEQRVRERGVGKLTMQYLLNRAAEQGFNSFYCDVEASNTAARQLYEQLGMKSVRVLRSSPSSPLDNLVRLRKDLTVRNGRSLSDVLGRARSYADKAISQVGLED